MPKSDMHAHIPTHMPIHTIYSNTSQEFATFAFGKRPERATKRLNVWPGVLPRHNLPIFIFMVYSYN